MDGGGWCHVSCKILEWHGSLARTSFNTTQSVNEMKRHGINPTHCVLTQVESVTQHSLSSNASGLHAITPRFTKYVASSLCSPKKILEGWTKMKSGFSTDFSMVSSPNRLLTPLKKCFEHPDFIFCSSFQNLRLGWIKLPLTASKDRSERLVRPSQIFVWEGCNCEGDIPRDTSHSVELKMI